MKILIAIDSLKGSLSSIEAGEAIKKGAQKAIKGAEVLVMPLADGGEGTVDALVEGMNGQKKYINVKGPRLKEVNAKYGVVNNTAIIEMAEASGITLVTEEEKNPLYTTTYGVGEIIKEAIENGCRDFIVA